MKDLDDEVLSYAEVKALALGDPRLRDLAQLENEFTSYQLLSEEFEQEISTLKNNIPALKDRIEKQEETYRHTLTDLENVKTSSLDDYKELRKKTFFCS